jgi:hypothetical protein
MRFGDRFPVLIGHITLHIADVLPAVDDAVFDVQVRLPDRCGQSRCPKGDPFEHPVPTSELTNFRGFPRRGFHYPFGPPLAKWLRCAPLEK